MDWLSKRKFVIVCHEKVVRIPLEGDEILQVHGERTQGVVKTLMNTKEDDTGQTKVRRSRHEYGTRRKATWFRLTDGKERRREFVFYRSYLGSIDNSKEWNSGDDQLRLRWMIYLVVLADAAESIRDTIGFESPILWAEIGESSLTGPELVLDTTDKVVLIKEKLKAERDRQKSYADKRRKPLEFEVGDRVLLKVYHWERRDSFWKERLPEELSGVHDTFHVSNLKKCLADANLHVPLNEINVNQTLCFVEEPVEIMDREIRSLKRSKISLMKVRWNSKRGPEFTWEREDHMNYKYPLLFVDRAEESAS
ncbi:hypothetical protein Tco_0897501 [Tanacetum coccineum]